MKTPFAGDLVRFKGEINKKTDEITSINKMLLQQITLLKCSNEDLIKKYETV